MNTGVANGQPSSEYTQSSNDSNGSHQSPPGSPALNEATDKYQTFSISEKEGESDVGEEIQLIDNDLGLGNGRVMITEETTKDSDLEGKPVNVCTHHGSKSVLSISVYPSCVCRKRQPSPCFKRLEFL